MSKPCAISRNRIVEIQVMLKSAGYGRWLRASGRWSPRWHRAYARALADFPGRDGTRRAV